MAHHHPPDDIITHNQTELDELAWSIEMSLGQFRIYFARCNYIRLRSRLIQQLQALTSVQIRVVDIKASERTLYARIQAELGDETPDAAMVLGLEAVENSRQLLSATNQVREEFRKHFSFPLVLWVNDQGFKDFLTYAPDFQSWGITSHFLMPKDELIAVLRENVDNFFAGCLHLTLDHCREIHQATQDLPGADYQGNPELAATVETLRGVIQAGHPSHRNLDQALIHYQNSAALWQDCNQVERQGKLLQELAIGYSLKAASIDEIQHPDWQAARQYVQQCLAVFEAAQRPDLVANSLSSLGQILRRLGEWQELQRWAEQAIFYHKQANLSSKLAADYGVLAQVALAEANWHKAQDLAQQALDCLAASSTETDKPWQMAYAESQYRFTVAQAYSGLNQPQAAIENLERAQTVGSPEYDTALYLEILSQLQQGYFQQRRYVQAFEIKLRRQSIEQQYGLRAFVGAAWIQPQREAKLAPTAGSPAYSQPGVGEMIAPEIAASGRQLDVERLIERIGRNDCKLIVIHGQSGVGKSSLVQGGLVPALKQKVMGTSDTLSVTMRVYSHWQEELAQVLAKALADNGVNPLPDGVETLHATSLLGQTERLNLRTVLIFDQFEEFFFVYPDARARRRFFEFIGQCLKISPVKVVLSLREDYLHYLLECNYLESMKVIGNDILSRNILYRLGNFSAADTQSIIQRLTERSSFHLETALIEALVQDLAGDVGEVRPIELQVVGAQLQTEKITRLAEYRQYGEQAKEVLVQRYLDEVVADCGEENRQAAELVLYLLTDEKGTRPLKTRAEIERDLQQYLSVGQSQGLEIPLPSPFERGKPEDVPPFQRGVRGDSSLAADWIPEAQQLDLVLQIFVKSGLVLLLPENPEQRYQLVHDYLAAFIRQQQEPRLQELIAELEKERKQRLQAEAQRQLTQAELERTEQARVRLNRQVRRALAGLALTGVMAGVIVVSLGGWATKTVGDAKSEVSAAENKIEQAEAKSKQAETKANQAETQVKQAQTQLGTVQTQLEKAQTKTQAAETKQKQAEAKRQAAQKQVQQAQRQMQAANQNLKTAQAKVNQAQQQYEAANQAAETARKTVETARREQAQLQEQVQLAETALQAAKAAQEAAQIAQKEAQEGTRLEREGTNAIKEFEYQRFNALISAMAAGQELQTIVKNRPLKDYPATSPLLALQTIQDNIQERVQLTGHQSHVLSANFSPDGERIVTASADNTARVWDRKGNLLTELKGHQSYVNSANFSPDGERIVTASWDKTARVWDRKGNLLTELKGHQSEVYSANFSPDGERIVTASWDKTARVWDRKGNLLTELKGHQSYVTSANFSPDGERIVTASEDNTARVWDRKGNLLTELKGHQSYVYSANFSPDGERIVTASWDNTARVWRADGLDSLLARGCDWLNQHLIFNPQDLEKLTVCQTPDNKTAAAQFWLYQGETQARNGNIQPAVELFRKALAWNPNFNLNPQQKAEQLAEASALVTQGEKAAREGNIEDAVTAFNRARELDPSLTFNPETQARVIAASALVNQGESAAREGNIDEAVTAFNRARELDPSLKFNPEIRARGIAASNLVSQGENAAYEGKLDEAVTAFNRARELDPSLKFNPEIRARGIAASNLVSQGENAAYEGKLDEAVTAFNRARELDPSLDVKPETKAASLLVERGQRLADDGQITEALAAYSQAKTLDPTVEIPAQAWKQICWIGSINGEAQDIIIACEKAVEVAQENDRGFYQDRRGLARALTGDIQGAIEDFQAYIDWINIEQEKSQPQSQFDLREDILAERQDYIDYLEKMKVQRQGWIEALKDGENPFTPEELESLRNQ